MKSPHKGAMRIVKAFKYSYEGFCAAFKNEAAFRQDLLFCVVFFAASFFIDVSYIEKILMISSLILILIMELINSAVEACIDRISDEYHELSKRAKDIGSLLVLISFINVFMVWGIILYNRFWWQ
jgi:diacylglycerol kinase (ATP)